MNEKQTAQEEQHTSSPSAEPAVSPSNLNQRLLFSAAISNLPLLSIISVVLVAIFNIGYFYPIGLHFLGTVDLTNFAYSFALIFGVLVGALQSGIWLTAQFFEFGKRPDAWAKFRKVFLPISIASFALMLALMVIPKPYLPTPLQFSFISLTAFLWSLAFIFNLMGSYLWYRNRTLNIRDISLLVSSLVFAVFFIGQAIAMHEIFSNHLYKIITKDSVIVDAALVRSSSMGFIISLGGKIIFMPKEEVRQIISQTAINQ